MTIRNRRTFDVDIKLRFSVLSDGSADTRVSPVELEDAVAHVMSDWNDGRYPFAVEAIHRGAESVVEAAVASVVERRMRNKYPSEMVEQHGGSTARAVVEAEKVLDEVNVYFTASREEVVSVRKARNPEPSARPLAPGERCTRGENHPAGVDELQGHHHRRWRQRDDGGRCAYVEPAKDASRRTS